MSRAVGIAGTAAYLPSRVMDAEELAALSGIPAAVYRERFGLAGKHVAAPDEHVSDMATRVGAAVLEETGTDPLEVDAVVYFGSTWKDHPVWQAAPAIAHRLGCSRAFALELDYVSCGAPVALRVGRDLLRAESELRHVLLVAACREAALVDYANPRSRFAHSFADGAVAALLVGDAGRNLIGGCAMATDGSLAHHVMVPAGGSVEPASQASVAAGRHRLDVTDGGRLKSHLDAVSTDRFVAVAQAACKDAGATLDEVDHLCAIHVKTSMREALVAALGVDPARVTRLDDTGHMSGVDALLALDRTARGGALHDGDLILLLAAGTGYTWAATTVRWGPARP